MFQLESGGMQELARQLHLDKFEEIIAVGALYRPGPMDMIPSYIARKHGREPIEYDHPWVKDILSETYGIMVYQEQVMQIASRWLIIPWRRRRTPPCHGKKRSWNKWRSSARNSA